MSDLIERDESKPAEEQGLFRKFEVRRVDGSDAPGGKHFGCRYFVLDVDHDPHARAALTAYADACEPTHPNLARDLREKWGALRSMQAQEPDGFLDTRTGSLLHIVPADNAGRYRPLYAAPVSPAGLVERLARSLAEDYVGDDAKAEYRWENTDRIWRDGWMAKARQHLSALEPAAQPAQPEWREITEDDRPPHGQRVLLGWRDWRDGTWLSEAVAYSTGQRYDSGYSSMSEHGSATHWMPLPAAPSEGA